MAVTWHVYGPNEIEVALDPETPSWVKLGRSDNDDLVTFEIEDFSRAFTRNDLGDMVAEEVLTGSEARLSFSLIHYDEDVFTQIHTRMRVGTTNLADEGKHAQVGALMRTTPGRLISVRVLTSRAGEKSYTIKYASLLSPNGLGPFGAVAARRIGMFRAWADPATGLFYTHTVNT